MGHPRTNKVIPSPSVLFLVFFSSHFLFLLFGVVASTKETTLIRLISDIVRSGRGPDFVA